VATLVPPSLGRLWGYCLTPPPPLSLRIGVSGGATLGSTFASILAVGDGGGSSAGSGGTFQAPMFSHRSPSFGAPLSGLQCCWGSGCSR